MRQALLARVGQFDLNPRLAHAGDDDVAKFLVREALPELEVAVRAVRHRSRRCARLGRHRRGHGFRWEDDALEDFGDRAALLGPSVILGHERDSREELFLDALDRFEDAF